MRAWLAAALFLAPLLAAADPPPEAAPPAVVRLVWRDPLHQLPDGFDAVAREAARVLVPLGIELRWRSGTAPASPEETLVILLPDDPARRSEQVMGRVNPSIRCGFWVYTRPVRAALGLDSFRARRFPLEDRRLFTRGLGRVVAHEIVHHLRPDLPHAADGLMQARLRQGTLAAPEAAFAVETTEALHQE